MQTHDSALRSRTKKSRAQISAESTEKVICPGIRRWLTDNGWTVFRLSTETGLSENGDPCPLNLDGDHP